MTFKHKLAHRLALLRDSSIAAAILLAACEQPISLTNPGSAGVAQLLISPKIITMYPAQTTDVMAVAFTAAGDTATGVSVTWSVTGGTLLSTTSSGGKHYGQYKSGGQTGKYKVVATAGGVSDSASVTVAQVPVATVVVNPASATVNLGQTVQLTATPQDSTGAPLTGRSVTWASNNGSVATVNATGLVSTGAVGSATITATSEGKSGTAAITVVLVPVASVTVSPASASVQPGGTVQFSATPKDASGNPLTGRAIAWSSSAPGIATVSGGGLVTGVAAGTATITATSEGKTGTAAVTVNNVPVASVSVAPASASVQPGGTVQLSATPKDASGNPLTGRAIAWSSSAPGIATVNGGGLVTGVAAGTATITATSEGKTGTAAVTVNSVPVASVTVSPATASIVVGQTVQLSATPKDASGNVLTGRVITWASNNGSVATVNGTGLVTALAAGTVVITVACESATGTAGVTVTNVPVASVTVSPATASLLVGQTVQLTATPKDVNGNPLSGRLVAWVSSNSGLASVTGGLVTGVATGSATITATSEGQSGTAAITVTAAPPPSGTWPNQPTGWTVINDYDMHALNNGGWTNGYPSDISAGLIGVTSDATGPYSPPSVWQFAFPIGYTGGGAPLEYLTFASTNVAYMGFYWKPSNPWQGHPSGVNKIVEFRDNTAGFGSYFLKMLGTAPPYHTEVTFETDQPTVNYDENQDTTPVALGQWHLMEFLVDGNSNTVKWWMDGKLKGSYSGVHYGGAFMQAEVTPIWGGINGTKTENDFYWFDHVHISKP
jgi:trimeric autotransporter adhesin